jgi:ADP-heptose:LPS heptosyltransferase
MTDLSHELTDFGETAALIENLDMIITVDTSMGHLAGRRRSGSY